MVCTITELLKQNDILSISQSENAFLLLRKGQTNSKILSLYRRKEKDDIEKAFDSFPHSWIQTERKDISKHIALDSATSLIYVVSANEESIFVFRQENQLVDPFHVESLNFRGSIQALKAIDTPDSQWNIIAAVSDLGEIKFLWPGLPNMNISSQSLEELSLKNIQHISLYNANTLVIVSIEKGKVFVTPISIVWSRIEKKINIKRHPQFFLPDLTPEAGLSKQDKSRLVLSSCFQPTGGIVLYSNGIVQIFAAQSGRNTFRQDKGEFWSDLEFTNQTPDEPASVEYSNPIASFKLSPESTNNIKLPTCFRTPADEVGDIAPLPGGYFAVAYGRNLSVWDGKFGLGHEIVDISTRITSIVIADHPSQLIACTASGLTNITRSRSETLSLGLAIRLRGKSIPIVLDVYTEHEDAPYRAQALTTAPTKAAAEGHGSATRIFQRALKGADDEELVIARKILNRELTPNAESIQEAMKDYTSAYYKLKKGDRSDGKIIGLKKLPSESLGALVVGRCLNEIQVGNTEYIIPIIDIIGTGIVSGEASLTMCNMSAPWKMDEDDQSKELDSLIIPLLSSTKYFNVLEAIVTKVSDLTAEDIVQVFQYAVQYTSKDKLSSKVTPSKKRIDPKHEVSHETIDARKQRLIRKCILANVDRLKIVEAIGRFSLSKVIPMLETLGKLVDESLTNGPIKEHETKNKTATKNKSHEASLHQDPSDYRGIKHWLDVDKRCNQSCTNFVNCCIDWINYIIDAQFTNLILDDQCQTFLQQLLTGVQQRKKEVEALRQIDGMVNHLLTKKPLPVMDDPLYRVKTIQIPEYIDL